MAECGLTQQAHGLYSVDSWIVMIRMRFSRRIVRWSARKRQHTEAIARGWRRLRRCFDLFGAEWYTQVP